MQGFKAFLLRGNVVDLAIAVVVGAAFGTVVDSFVSGLLTPLIAAIGGQPDFSRMSFTINNSQFLYGEFINAVVSFVIIASVVYFVVLMPMNRLMALTKKATPPVAKTTRECPECLSEIPLKARRCAFCTAEVGVVAAHD